MGGAACAKIIRNGLRIIQITENIVEDARKAEAKAEYIHNDMEIVKCLNEMEDIAFKMDRLYLEGEGFTGPWPHSMSEKPDYTGPTGKMLE